MKEEFFHRIFVEKNDTHKVEDYHIYDELVQVLQINKLQAVRHIVVYDVCNISKDDLLYLAPNIFIEAPRNHIYTDLQDVLNEDFKYKDLYAGYIAMEYLPGQYDQSADAAMQCLALQGQDSVEVHTGQVLLLYGDINTDDIKKISSYYINTVEMRNKDLDIAPNRRTHHSVEFVDTSIEQFITKTQKELEKVLSEYRLSMSVEDLECVQEYFKSEGRNPTDTEIKILDTYWSDHCRHTTFLTELEDIENNNNTLQRGLNLYKSLRTKLGKEQKAMTLMDIATIAAKSIIADGKIQDIDISEEINACSMNVEVEVEDGNKENWLLMFKNETHNHPTEIEPFGGASTCLGGAIRDPLSGRSYVFAGMRCSGAANPLESIENTITHKLPQRYIAQKAALGFSSYGNQVGIPTNVVKEIYHEGYKAKRLEAGFVMGAAPKDAIVREIPQAGDIVLLVGGKTGRDGIGGAVGSSKTHTQSSIVESFAEVQKGNPIEAHALQRLFRNVEVARLIKRCNDFGAGGVSVAVGELADGLCIDLDKVPVKYQGLDGTELAISESQERMAVVVDRKEVQNFIELAQKENIFATEIARVTEEKRIKMKWRGHTVVDISREFLNTNGAKRSAKVDMNVFDDDYEEDINITEDKIGVFDMEKHKILKKFSELNLVSQHGLQEMFDSTVGSRTVLMPYGGYRQESPAEGLAVLFPTQMQGFTKKGLLSKRVALASLSCPIETLEYSPYHGASYAIVNSISKIIAMGGSIENIKLSFQEFFRRLGEEPKLWAYPTAALLGALEAQYKLNVPAIGGKDSMSGNFEKLYVPPTFISFAVGHTHIDKIKSTELKSAGNYLYLLRHNSLQDATPNYEQLLEIWKIFDTYNNIILSAISLEAGGIFVALLKMCVGNNIGVEVEKSLEKLFYRDFIYENEFERIKNTLQGSILIESESEILDDKLELVAKTISQPVIKLSKHSWNLDDLREKWSTKLNSLYPSIKKNLEKSSQLDFDSSGKDNISNELFSVEVNFNKQVKARVCIPVFPGQNCEEDTANVVDFFGGDSYQSVFLNRNQEQIKSSIDELSKEIKKSQIFVLVGGFSLGDQPDGAGKYIANVLQAPKIVDALYGLLARDGLVLGICNGFQALIKSGWLPYGSPKIQEKESPTLSTNISGLHISYISHVRVHSAISPWCSLWKEGDEMLLPVSHGEGRFVVGEEGLKELQEYNQISTVYVSKDENPNGSVFNVEGISSKDGKIFGRMGHAERISRGLLKNIPHQELLSRSLLMFKAGLDYFE